MKEFLNKNTLFNTAAMLVAGGDKLALVLEGDDDHLLLKEFRSVDLFLIPATGGKSQVLAAAEYAKHVEMKHGSRIRFLVDRDYDNFHGHLSSRHDNILTSDCHDIFMDILNAEPKVIRRVIEVNVSSVSRRNHGAPSLPKPEDIAKEALTLASRLSAVRVVDARRSLRLHFVRFSFGGLEGIDVSTGDVARLVLDGSNYGGGDEYVICKEADKIHLELMGRALEIVGDHDFFGALARVLREYKVQVRAENLHKGVILNVSCSALVKNEWYRIIQQWAADHGLRGFIC